MHTNPSSYEPPYCFHQTLNQRWQDECYRIGFDACRTIPDLYIEQSAATGSVTYATPRQTMTLDMMTSAHHAGVDVMFLLTGYKDIPAPSDLIERTTIYQVLTTQFNQERDMVRKAIEHLESTWELCAKQLQALPETLALRARIVEEKPDALGR